MIDFDDDVLDDDFGGLVAEWGEIGARLRRPTATLDLEGFAASLERGILTIRLAGYAHLAGDPGLPGRLRGAFGTVLTETASPEALAGRPCAWTPPCAFEALFRKQGRMTPGTDFPSPWIVQVDPRRGDLEVRLILFGLATNWMPAAAEALVAAVARVDWAGTTGLFLPRPRIVARSLTRSPPSDERAGPPRALILDTLSPLVSSGEGAALDPAAAFTTLGRRLEGLARWQEATLDIDLRAVAADLRRAQWHWLSLEPIEWARGSRRQDRSIPMGGVLGRLEIVSPPEDLARLLPLFRLGEATHAGADIAFGCGRYRLTPVV